MLKEQESSRIKNWPVVLFSFYMALMLYQPEGLGTYAAFVTIMLTLVACVLSGKVSLRAFYMPTISKAIFLFLVMITITTMFKSSLPSTYYKFAAQIVLFIVLQNISIDEVEYNYLKWIFILANVVYAIVAIRYCMELGDARYYHSSIVVFGATFDPNYIGISFVASLTFLLDNILKGHKRVVSIFLYFIFAVAIIYTASRGNMLAWITTSVLIIAFFIKSKDVSGGAKWFWIIAILISLAFAITYLATHFTLQWERMTQIGLENDNGRFELWDETLDLWEKSPIFGNGLRSMYNQYSRASHNTYLQILVDGGIVGFLLMLIFFGRLLRKTFSYDKVLFSVLIGMLLQMAFLDAVDNRCVWCLFCIIAMIPEEEVGL